MCTILARDSPLLGEGAVDVLLQSCVTFPFCFSFSTSPEAEAAVEALDGESLLGKVIQCNIARFKKDLKKKKNTSG